MKSSLEIAQEAELIPIEEIAERCGLDADEIEPYGRYKGKVNLSVIDRLRDRPDGKLVCVTGMTPTKAGEGKTTTLVGLTQGLGHIGKKPVACLREPSLGPVFGIKGGAAGGGMTQVVPRTTCSRRCSTPRFSTATRTRSTSCASAGAARST